MDKLEQYKALYLSSKDGIVSIEAIEHDPINCSRVNTEGLNISFTGNDFFNKGDIDINQLNQNNYSILLDFCKDIISQVKSYDVEFEIRFAALFEDAMFRIVNKFLEPDSDRREAIRRFCMAHSEGSLTIEEQFQQLRNVRSVIPLTYIPGRQSTALDGEVVLQVEFTRREGNTLLWDQEFKSLLLKTYIKDIYPDLNPDKVIIQYATILMIYGDAKETGVNSIDGIEIDINFILESYFNKDLFIALAGSKVYEAYMNQEEITSWFQKWNIVDEVRILPGMHHYCENIDQIKAYLSCSRAYWAYRRNNALSTKSTNKLIGGYIKILLAREVIDLEEIKEFIKTTEIPPRESYESVVNPVSEIDSLLDAEW